MEAPLDLAVEGVQINYYLTVAEWYQFHLPRKRCMFQGKGRITFAWCYYFSRSPACKRKKEARYCMEVCFPAEEK